MYLFICSASLCNIVLLLLSSLTKVLLIITQRLFFSFIQIMMHAIRIHVAMVELVQRMQQVINVPVSLVMWEIIVKVGIPLLLFVTDSKLYFIKDEPKLNLAHLCMCYKYTQ